MKTRRGVGDDGWPSPAEARRSWGEDFILSPTRAVPELPPAGGQSEEMHRTKTSRRE